MRIYTLTYDCNTPTKQQVSVPTNTAYKVGIKVIKNGEVQDIAPGDMTLGATSADETKTNGYVTFTKNAGDNASFAQDTLTIDADNLKATFTLITNVYKSQLGDLAVGGSGGGVTEQWVQEYVTAETSAFVTDTELGTVLEAYPTTSDMTGAISTAVSAKVTNLGDVAGIMKITQSAYDALVSAGTVVSTTCYLITE